MPDICIFYFDPDKKKVVREGVYEELTPECNEPGAIE
jgi:hypothetical protein